jgi:hypothetical protein
MPANTSVEGIDVVPAKNQNGDEATTFQQPANIAVTGLTANN